jgi:biotin operon repressor
MLLVPSLVLPSEAPTLADAVAQAVRDGVAAGELVPDVTYSVYQLAELLGVSRSPVREGLLRLAEAGLIEILRNRGFRVLPPRAQPSRAPTSSTPRSAGRSTPWRARPSGTSGRRTGLCTTFCCVQPASPAPRPSSRDSAAPQHCSGRPRQPAGGR